MKIFYDTEFIDDGKTIELISIGMISETGNELYLVNKDASLARIYHSPWLYENVWPSLPADVLTESAQLYWHDKEEVVSHSEIRDQVSKFILDHSPKAPKTVELWAWYGAYDHVALAQLWGPMSELPRHIPMWTNDLRQEVLRLEKAGLHKVRWELPKHDGAEHHALADARHLKLRYEWVQDNYGKYV